MNSRKQLPTFFALLLIAISVRVLTLQFMRAHLNDPAWFQVGSYAKFDRQARDILDGRQRLFWIDDATRTDLVQYPPAFPALVALIYKISGDHSAFSVQLVQWFVDLVLSFFLIMGIAFTAFGRRAAIVSGFLLALSPLFALYAAYPSTDMPTTWFVLGGNWLLLLAFQRRHLWLALAAGLLSYYVYWRIRRAELAGKGKIRLIAGPVMHAAFWLFVGFVAIATGMSAEGHEGVMRLPLGLSIL